MSIKTLTEAQTAVAPRAARATLALALAVSTSCGKPPVVAKQVPSAIVSRRTAELDPSLLSSATGEREGDAYRLGPGDTLLVAVYDHPELSIAPFIPAGASSLGGRPVGLLIDNDGTVQLPLLAAVHVQGMTTEEVRAMLEDKLGVFVKNPRVAVQLVFAGSIRYYLLGQFTNPGLKFTDRPLGLLEALSLGGSVDLAKASLRTAYVARAGKKLPVDFRRLVLEGDTRQNIRLHTGDVVVVPDRENEQAFVFGGTMNSDPQGGAVAFVNGSLTLLQALAKVGFGAAERWSGKLSDVHIIRSEGGRGELFIVDASAILDGQAAPFDLAPGDVVYVPSTALADWDQALNAIIPFLNTVAGVLTPFVQYKYLTQH